MNKKIFDIIVVGGGSAGVAAAWGAAGFGAETLIIERNNCLGGASTMRNVVTYCGLYTLEDRPKLVVGGVADYIVAGLKKRDAITKPQRHRGVFAVFDPESLKTVLDEVCSIPGISLLMGSFVSAVERVEENLVSVTVVSHSGQTEYFAKAFVDCSGDGDLSEFGGAETRYGNCQDVNLGTLGIRFGGIPGTVSVTSQDIEEAVTDMFPSLQGVTKKRSVVARMPISSDLVSYLASEAYDARNPVSMTLAEKNGRQQSWHYLQAIRSISGCDQAYIVSTGPEFGTRESRHITSRKQLKWSDIQARSKFDDCIALGAWGAEWHDRRSYESTFDYSPTKSAYDIPLSCLWSENTPNLFAAGRLADGDRLAGAAIRVMGTAFATGHAAGIAAAHVASGQSWGIKDIQKTLKHQGGILEMKDAREVSL